MSKAPLEGAADHKELIEALDRFSSKTDMLLRSNGNTNNSRVTISTDGIGVWVATTACMVMLAALIVGGFWVSREFNRIDSRFNDQTDTDSVQDAYIQKLRAEQKQERK